MKFISIRDLRKDTAGLRRDLEANREIILTANGKPIAVMTRVGPDDVEEEILAIRRARAKTESQQQPASDSRHDQPPAGDRAR